MRLDIPFRVREQMGDPNVPLFITEGAKKADAIVSRGACCIALSGVWNWRGKNRFGGKAALADWELIALNDRQVYIVFDSDVMVKGPVRQALNRLVRFLESRGARVRCIYLPDTEGGSDGRKQGVDDYLVAGRTIEGLLELAEKAAPVDEGLGYTDRGDALIHTKQTQDGPVDHVLTNFSACIVEEIVQTDGIDSSLRFRIEGRSKRGPLQTIEIAAEHFAGLSWVAREWGSSAIVYAGPASRIVSSTACLSNTTTSPT